jgi:hypothetical protein
MDENSVHETRLWAYGTSLAMIALMHLMLGIFAQTAESVYSRGYVLTVELRYRYTLAFERPYSFMSALISAP